MENWTAQRAAALCAAMGYTLAEFAEYLGLSRSTVAKWNRKTNPRNPGREAQDLLAVALTKASPVVRAQFHRRLGEVPQTRAGSYGETAGDPRMQVVDSATQAEQLANDVAALGSDADLIDYQRAELGRLAVEYVHAPLPGVFADLRHVQNTLTQALRTPQRPSQTHDLMFLAGVTSILLAHASQNLGDHGAALKHLRAAATLATAVDSTALRAWACGSSALFHEWSRQPGVAVADALKGLQYNAGPQTRRRLLAIAARSAARARRPDVARELLARLDEPPERGFTSADSVEDFGGLLSFPMNKKVYYVGGTYALLGDHDNAERFSAQAIRSYEEGLPEERSYGDLALARLDHAHACLGQDNLVGAAASVTQILGLPSAERISQLDEAVTSLRDRARKLAGRQHRAAGELADSLTGYLVGSPRALPSGCA
ncbi:helix-turn-helix domain-containing protein [Amycolatopsis sp. FBCC-B4732]|uniref:helix-turn-helix transcriptional regulator n=1 Tax=Amycolatopsis sp. FBCC-B4732 TaxID=3079339 RepID=UPI001FF6F5B9|nr:helix-turn-helix transcriptional regulator [Amycolatopsis sp. FBCC-B4732]UOX88386.1 helix-turn-helix domain-containing protein [Amycolatopsis sp. FBCC-B4732]